MEGLVWIEVRGYQGPCHVSECGRHRVLTAQIGDTSNYVHRGIAPRALAQIFREVAARTQVVFKVTVTYQEIYNERYRPCAQSRDCSYIC